MNIQGYKYSAPPERGSRRDPPRQYADTPVRRYASTPLRRYAATPLRRYADTPIRRYGDTAIRRYGDTAIRRYAAWHDWRCESAPDTSDEQRCNPVSEAFAYYWIDSGRGPGYSSD